MSYVFSQEEIEQLCKEWQQILRLQDWDIVVKIERQRNFILDDVHAAECDPELKLKENYIKILDPIDFPDDAVYPQDQEKTLVHELLHCHFRSFEPERDTLEYDLLEQAVETIAKALVKLKRQKMPVGD